MSLPSDSDEASLDAIAANGKPLTLAEAIDLAFRSQPRLRAQIESIAQARGAQQIVFSTFLPMVAGVMMSGGYQPGSGRHSRSELERPAGIQFLARPWSRAYRPQRSGRISSWPNSRSNGCSSTSAVAWASTSRPSWSTTSLGLQTERAYQTVANDVAVAYYNVLRSQALRRTAQDALRRAEEELADARKREREGVVEREVVLRSEVQRAENLQELHAATGAEFVALAGLNLAIGLKCDQPVRVVESPEIPPLSISLADCLQTAVQERREFYVIQRTVEIAVARGPRGPGRVCAQSHRGWHLVQLPAAILERPRRFSVWGSSGSSGCCSRAVGGSPRPAWRTRRCVRPWHRPSRSPINIAFQVNEAYRNAVTAWVGIDDARPAVDQASENFRLVKLRLGEGAATPTEIADAQASLTRAQQNYLNSRYNYLIALDRLEYAMGVGRTPMISGPTSIH